jgi:putative transposase
MSRIVVAGLPHLVTHRGVRSTPIFRNDKDRRLYLSLLRQEAKRFGLKFEGWCLMVNRVYLVPIPADPDSLARGIGQAHRQYARARNLRKGVRGHLFQGRFASCVLDEAHLARAVRHAELSPVRAGLVDRPEDYRWSSARFHLRKIKTDRLKTRKTALRMVGDWTAFLRESTEKEAGELELRVSTGRPWVIKSFLRRLEKSTRRRLTAGKPGWPKGKRRRLARKSSRDGPRPLRRPNAARSGT